MTGVFIDMSVGEIRAVARRQLTGSIIAGILVVAVASLVALRPAHTAADMTTAHSSVQQPVFVVGSDHMIAARDQRIETP